jgi:hypothetical protein
MDWTVWPALGALIFVWAGASLLLGEFFGRLIGPKAGSRLNWLQHGIVGLHNVVAIVPVVWVLAVAALVARVYAHTGQWPKERRVDPFGVQPEVDLSALTGHFEFMMIAGAVTIYSGFVFPALHGTVRPLLVGRSLKWGAMWLGGWLLSLSGWLALIPLHWMSWYD